MHDEYLELIKKTRLYLEASHHPSDKIPWSKKIEVSAPPVPPKSLPKPPPPVPVKVNTPVVPPRPIERPGPPPPPRIVAEPPKESDLPSFKELYDFHALNFPHLSFKEEIPADLKAPLPPKQKKEIDIAILLFNDSQHDTFFLTQVARAITTRFQLNAVCIKGANFEPKPYKYVIACDYGIQGHLGHHLKEASGKSYLGNSPLMMLPDLSLYRREPKLKSALWKALCQEIASLK
jgi:hypothetical protein